MFIVGVKTQHAIWFYLEQRQPKRITEALFATIQGGFYSPEYFRQKINELGKKTEIDPCYPHRFRHTCALLRIKNGETAESLQHLLGHTTPKMAMYYVKLAALDLEQVQKNASPIDNLIY
jgi:integrase/recombinase XerD